MTETEYDVSFPEERPPRFWQNPLSWSFLAAAAFLVYEVTAQPGLSAAVLCLKFGWNDFRTAWWLWRIDGNRRRGRVCFWLYLASALWKVAITGAALAFAFPIVEGLLNPQGRRQVNGGGLPVPFLVAILTTCFGFFFSVMTTLVALWGSWRHGVRLWLDSSLHQARRHDIWPSYFAVPGVSNKTGRLVLTALLAGYVVGAILAIASLISVNQAQKLGGIAITLVAFFSMFAGPVLVLALREFVVRRLLAVSPWQCWGDEFRRPLAGQLFDDLAYHENPNPDL